MFGEITSWLLNAIQSHGILAVILGVIIETIIVPIPSPLILMAAGAILIESGTTISIVLNALWISAVAGLAQTLGSYLIFFLAYYGGKPIIEKFEKFHGVSWKEIKVFQKKFMGRKEEVTLFLLRAIPIMPISIASGVAGVIKMDWREYTLFTFLGTIPRNLILALLGFFMKDAYTIFAGKIDHMESIVTLFLVGCIGLYVMCHKLGIFWKIRKNILK